MKWNKSTRFALYAVLEMAERGEKLTTIQSTATKYDISAHHLAKVMQTLVRGGIATGVRGIGGGYRLARAPRDITLLDVVEVFEGKLDLTACSLEGMPRSCEALATCKIKRVFDEIEQQAYFTLKSITLATLASTS